MQSAQSGRRRRLVAKSAAGSTVTLPAAALAWIIIRSSTISPAPPSNRTRSPRRAGAALGQRRTESWRADRASRGAGKPQRPRASWTKAAASMPWAVRPPMQIGRAHQPFGDDDRIRFMVARRAASGSSATQPYSVARQAPCSRPWTRAPIGSIAVIGEGDAAAGGDRRLISRRRCGSARSGRRARSPRHSRRHGRRGNSPRPGRRHIRGPRTPRRAAARDGLGVGARARRGPAPPGRRRPRTAAAHNGARKSARRGRCRRCRLR